jgi:biotin/methionine sulfoxide reductase
MAPVARKGWLAGDKGANRCDDSFVEISWDRATRLAADEINRVRSTWGNGALYGGSYGWSSAGRFHHAQSLMRRVLALSGGFTSSRETYSHAAAEVLFPHILGVSNYAFQDNMTAMPLVARHCELFLAFGGIHSRTAQIASAGTSKHEVGPLLQSLAEAGVRLVNVSPERTEAGEWLSLRPGTDTALILALIHEIIAAGREDRAFLETCTTGWDTLKAYVMGEADGAPKSAAWAAPICDLDPQLIRDLAAELPRKRTMISMAWGMQRADHGEQTIWAGLALACVLGQIGQPGTGYAFGYGSTTPVGRAARLIPWPSLPRVPNPVRDFIPVARIADALLNPGAAYAYDGQTRTYPDLKLVWWSGGNPYHHHQDLFRLEQAWTRPETVIVSEHSWTATARRADLVLPATTPLERDDLMMNRRDPALFYMSRFHDPVGQARDDFDFCHEIADHLGAGDAFSEGRSSAEWLQHMWAQAREVGRTAGFDMPDFETFRQMGRFDVPEATEHRIAFADFIKDPARHPVGTESGKFTLTNGTIAAMAHADCPGHPTWLPPVEGAPLANGSYHLISGQPATRLHSQNDQGSEAAASKLKGREVCTLHPETAAALGVTQDDILKLTSPRGACLCAVAVSDGVRADCLSLPTGAWFDPQTVNGERIDVHGNPNALTLDKGCSALSQGNIAHTCVVQAEKWDKPLPPLTVTEPPKIETA